MENDLPDVIKEINKSKKATKITTLTKAKAARLKKMFSGSVSVDAISNGGYAYRRIHLSFGSKSAGKNALLYQMMAYNQRLCRDCGGIRAIYWGVKEDRHSLFMKYVLKIPQCLCGGQGKIFLILDYEKSIDVEEPRKVEVVECFDRTTGEQVSDVEYEDANDKYKKLCAKEKLTEKQQKTLEDLEVWLDKLDVKKQIIEQLSTADYLVACGVLIDELLIADPEDTEEGIEHCRKIIKERGVDGIIWDSIQAAIPKWVKERDAEADTMGKEAKQNALLMRHICSSFAARDLEDEMEAYKPGFFLTSQMRSSMSMYEQDSYSGGHGIKHHISFALEHKRNKFLKEDGTEASFKEQFYGQEIRLRAEKNKFGPPGDMYTVDYYFRESEHHSVGEIDHTKEIVNLGISKGLIERAGAYYKTKGESFQGMARLTEFFRENPEFVGNLYEDIQEKL